MLCDQKLLIAKGEQPVFLLPDMANRHGLIAGATGTGKTITLKVMAESFSALGVPVFLADIKGDLAGMCRPGENGEGLQKRLAKLGIADFPFRAFPTRFWDVYGKNGHPVRTTVSEMGPLLLSRLLNLTPVQEGVLNIVFRVADERGLLLIDMKDLRAMLRYVGEQGAEYCLQYGNVSRQSVGAIQRALLTLEDAGGDVFFGEPALDIGDWMTRDENGLGTINILHCVELFQSPLLYATFLLWLLSELFERLPEVGDQKKPEIVFFFDEAHLLFSDAPKALVQKIEQVVKLIRSKGVGVYFITQSPADLPDSVLAQLGNRVQHALRAYTPAEQRAVRTAAESFRANPAFDTAEVITALGTGEALCSFLDERGSPGMVERAMVLPPQSRMGGIEEERRRNEIEAGGLYGKYDTSVDRVSAYETLTASEAPQSVAQGGVGQTEPRQTRDPRDTLTRYASQSKNSASGGAARPARGDEAAAKPKAEKTTGRKKKTYAEKAADSALNTISRSLGRKLARGLLGLLKS